MRSDNVEDFDFKKYQHNLSNREVNYLMQYNRNDVSTTMQLYERTLDVIKVREMYSEKYNLNLYSASNAKMSRELLLHMISEKMHVNKDRLRELRTPRSHIVVKDIIFPYIDLNSDLTLKSVYDWFTDMTVVNTKGEHKKEFN
jgi:hypothetical protein